MIFGHFGGFGEVFGAYMRDMGNEWCIIYRGLYEKMRGVIYGFYFLICL